MPVLHRSQLRIWLTPRPTPPPPPPPPPPFPLHHLLRFLSPNPQRKEALHTAWEETWKGKLERAEVKLSKSRAAYKELAQKNADMSSKLEATRRMVTLLMHHDKMGLAGRGGSAHNLHGSGGDDDVDDVDTDDDLGLDDDVGERPERRGRRRAAAKTVRSSAAGALTVNTAKKKLLSKKKSRAILRQGPAPEI